MLRGSLMIGVCDWWSTESRSFARLEELWFSRWLGLLQETFTKSRQAEWVAFRSAALEPRAGLRRVFREAVSARLQWPSWSRRK